MLITRPSIQNVFKKKCSLSLSPSIFGFRSNITCPRTNLAISFQVNTSHVIAVRQNLLPYLLDLLRFIELYLKHETERHCVGISPVRGGGKICMSREMSDSTEILITFAASRSLTSTITKLIYIFKQ